MGFRALILGAAAGGGLPQWNCGCQICDLARYGEIKSATQSSIAVSADGKRWVILNASPDIRVQLSRTPALYPTGLREVPLEAVLLTNGDIDHIAGLLTLREVQHFRLYATPGIHEVLDQNPIFDALRRDVVPRLPLALNVEQEVASGLVAELFPVPGKVPLYLEGENVKTDMIGEQTVGVALTSGDKKAFYIPGCAAMTDDLRDRLDGAELVFFDGTLWSDDEMQITGVGQKTGARMGHMSMSGPNGSIAAFQTLNVGRKVFIHMNNTNPVFRPEGPERAEARAAGWTIGEDGMEITL
ncbi:MAG: pyrroloquinoline quinone biosynthesis protein PqqB [Pseudomonadota bacterium]